MIMIINGGSQRSWI